jgi:RNA polymerase sigma-70 factor (ECF subfamily)
VVIAPALAEASDDELISKLQSGDASALGPLYQRYRGVVNAVIQRQIGTLSHSEAEDLSHEVFLTLMEIARRYRQGGSARAWLCGIATQKAKRMRHRRWVREKLLAKIIGPRRSNEIPAQLAEQRVQVHQILDRLPSGLRDVVILSLVEQLSPEDVAAALDIRVSTVWTRLHRARERVREMMNEVSP